MNSNQTMRPVSTSGGLAALVSRRVPKATAPSPRELRGSLLSLLEAAPGLVIVADLEGRVLHMNAAARSILGVSTGATLEKHRLREFYTAPAYGLLIEDAIPTCLRGGVWRGETTLLSRHREEIPVTEALVAHRVELDHRNVTVLAGLAWDMREQKRTERLLRRQATHDALTDCPNRTLMLDRLVQATHRAARRQRMVGVLFLDLDGFKQVNDRFGHEPANALLREVSQRLRARLRVEDTVARYGGDEFVVVVPDLGTPADIDRVTHTVRHVFDEPFVVAGRGIRVGGSVGVAIYPRDGESAESLLHAADADMYLVKKQTKLRAPAAEAPVLPQPVSLPSPAAISCRWSPSVADSLIDGLRVITTTRSAELR